MSDFAPGTKMNPVAFQAYINALGQVQINLTLQAITPSGTTFTLPTFMWVPQGPWQPVGDFQKDLALLQQAAIEAALAETGLDPMPVA